jgi:lipoprotein-releasing system permease protein
MIVVLSFVLSLLATLYPSWKAAKMNPAEALRYE